MNSISEAKEEYIEQAVLVAAENTYLESEIPKAYGRCFESFTNWTRPGLYFDQKLVLDLEYQKAELHNERINKIKGWV